MRNPLQFMRGRVGGIAAGQITTSVAIKAGYPLCYNFDFGTASAADETRVWYVEKPSTSNNYYFAGVAAESKPAGYEGPIKMFLPGSLCLVWTNQSCTLGTTIITAEAGEYRFGQAGFRGQGSARAMQTVNRSGTAGTVLALLDEGEQSGLMEVLTATNVLMVPMVGGVTHFATTTIETGNATLTLADGTWVGQKKMFILDGTQTTSDIVATVTTEMPVGDTGYTADAAVFNTYTMDAATEYLEATWNGQAWYCHGRVGTAA